MKTKWLAMLLNRGVDPHTNQTVVPPSTFDEMTTAHSVMLGAPPDAYTSLAGYGMGWMRQSFQGHDVRAPPRPPFFPTRLTLNPRR